MSQESRTKWGYLTWDVVKGCLVSCCSVAYTYQILTAQPKHYVAGKKLLPFSHFCLLLILSTFSETLFSLNITLYYNAQVVLDLECKSELKWWFRHLQDWNVKSLISPAPYLVITTDSSMMGWGALCNGTTTQGLWSPSEKLDHINVLELKAAMFAVMAFAKNLSQIHIHLRLDNQASVAQINKLGGGGGRSHRLFQITKVFWDFCLSRQIIITTDHVPGVQNQIADRESRVFLDKSCWMLNRSYFQQIEKIWGEADIDLFADRL